MKIRNRFLFTTITTSFIIFAIFTYIILVSQYREQNQKFNLKMVQTQKLAELLFFNSLWNVDYKYIVFNAEAMMKDDDIEAIEVNNEEARVYSKSKNRPGTKIRKEIPIKIEENIIGKVVIVFSKIEIEENFRKTTEKFLIMASVLFVSLFIIVFLSAISVSAPIEKIAKQVSGIGKGNFDAKIAINASGELKMLVNSINMMTEELKKREEEIKNITRESAEKTVKYEFEKQKYEIEKTQREMQERMSHELEISNQKLKESIETLKMTQSQLILSEKMAILGGLVAGVSHEINTPIGIGVTAASYLAEKTDSLKKDFTSGNLRKSVLEEYMNVAEESSRMLLMNLGRASELIRSFKQVSVDQTSEEKRVFNVKEYLGEIMQSMYPKLKKTKHTVEIECEEKLEVNTYPGAVAQILTNFIMNSIIHGFDGVEAGKIMISAEKIDEKLIIVYSDNGIGMNEEQKKKIFEPFFTTKRNSGGTGLGGYIVYNLVTQRLRGEIQIESSPGDGTWFKITIPL